MHPHVHGNIIYNSMIWKQLKCPPMDKWIRKGRVCVCVCVCVYHSAIKKNETLPYMRTWMKLEDIMLNEMSDRERQISYDLTYM